MMFISLNSSVPERKEPISETTTLPEQLHLRQLVGEVLHVPVQLPLLAPRRRPRRRRALRHRGQVELGRELQVGVRFPDLPGKKENKNK